MKIAVCVDLNNSSGKISKFFSKAEYYLIYDVDKEIMVDKIANHIRYSIAPEVFCAQLLIKRGINMVVCGVCENDAKKLFAEAGIKVLENITASPSSFLTELYLQYKNKELCPVSLDK